MTKNLTEVKTESKAKPNLKYMRDKDRENVKGIFRFYEVPGGTMGFVYKQYREDPVENYTLQDGQIYTIPLGVAKHLNKNGSYPEYEYMKTEAGFENHKVAYGMGINAGMRIGRRIRRFGFQSLDFMDPEDLNATTPIVTAEYI
jgi:hypothetical protein